MPVQVPDRYNIFVAANLPATSLRAEYGEGELSLPDDVRRQVAAYAAEVRRNAGRAGHAVRLEDRPIARLVGWHASDVAVTLRLGQTGYFHAIAGARHQREWAERWEPDALPNALAVSVATTTADGVIVLERRSSQVAEYPGAYHVKPAGQVQPPQSPLDALYQELAEEMAVDRAEVADARFLGITQNVANGKYEVVFSVAVRVTWDELHRRTPQDAWETDGLTPLRDDRATVEAWLLAHTADMVPPGHAALLLHGWQRHGHAWYAGMLRHLGAREVPAPGGFAT